MKFEELVEISKQLDKSEINSEEINLLSLVMKLEEMIDKKTEENYYPTLSGCNFKIEERMLKVYRTKKCPKGYFASFMNNIALSLRIINEKRKESWTLMFSF